MSRNALYLALIFGALLLLAGCFPPGEGGPDGALVINITNLPDGVDSISITVDGDDIDPIVGVFSAEQTEADAIIVPEGTGRTFTVVVEVSNDGPALEYTASGTVDIVSGDPTIVDVVIAVSRTKLVVPDPVNNRLVQIDDIFGGSWTTLTDLGGPTEAEVGPDGRIYMIYNVGRLSSEVGVIDDITDTTTESLSGTSYRIESIGVDHVNDRVFFSHRPSEDPDNLYEVPITGGTPTLVSLANENVIDLEGYSIRGITVDDEGFVYLLYDPWQTFSTVGVAKIEMGTIPTVLDAVIVFDSVESSVNSSEMDIVAKGDSIYIVLDDDTPRGPVIEIDTSLGYVASYGIISSGQPTGQDLFGPVRFVGHLNPKITFADDPGDAPGNDVLVQIDDISGANRTSFGSSGSGVDQFDFFEESNQAPQ